MNIWQKIYQYFHLYQYGKYWNIINTNNSKTYPDFIQELHILEKCVVISYKDLKSNQQHRCIIPTIQYKSKSDLRKSLNSLHIFASGFSHSPLYGYLIKVRRLQCGIILFGFSDNYIRPFIIKDLKTPHLSEVIDEINEIDEIEPIVSNEEVENGVVSPNR
jgi:hypothetical protein